VCVCVCVCVCVDEYLEIFINTEKEPLNCMNKYLILKITENLNLHVHNSRDSECACTLYKSIITVISIAISTKNRDQGEGTRNLKQFHLLIKASVFQTRSLQETRAIFSLVTLDQCHRGID